MQPGSVAMSASLRNLRIVWGVLPSTVVSIHTSTYTVRPGNWSCVRTPSWGAPKSTCFVLCKAEPNEMDLLGSYERGSTVLDAKRTPCTPYCGKADLAWAMPLAESQYAGWYELWLIADVSWSSYCCLTSHIRIWGSWPNQLPHCWIARTQLTKGDNCNRSLLSVTWSARIECSTLCCHAYVGSASVPA